MKAMILGGYGEMGRIASIDFIESCGDCKLTIAGRDGERARKFAASLKSGNVDWKEVDVLNKKSLADALEGYDVVLNATNYYYNMEVMEGALSAKVDYVDLGGLFYMTRKQLKLHDKFRKAGVTAILGIGSSPGITNLLALHGSRLLDRIKSIEISFADKSFKSVDVPFSVPYALSTLFDEFTIKPTIFKKGRYETINPLGSRKKISFPPRLGDFVCFSVVHSEMATLPKSFKSKGIEEVIFYEGFDSDFVGKIEFLINTGFISEKAVKLGKNDVKPKDLSIKLLNKFVVTDVKVDDIEYLRVELIGTKERKRKKVIVYCEVKSNKKWMLPAGSWDTGVPLSIAAQMLGKGTARKPGVWGAEMVLDDKAFFRELEKRGMNIVTTSEYV